MANSIEDMLKNQMPKKKKSGVKIIFLLLFLILIAAAAVVAYMYFKGQNKVTPKQYFLQYLGKGNAFNVTNLEKIENFATRFQSEQSESKTELTVNLPAGLIDDELDISEMKLELESKSDPEKEKNTSDILLTYKGNEVISFNMLMDKDKIGVFSEDIIVKYIGSKISNIPELISKLSGEEMNIGFDFDISKLKDMQIIFPHFSEDMLVKYGEVINQKVPDEAFATRPITLERASGKVDVTEYSMRLSEGQAIEVLDLMLQTLENDDDLLDRLFASLGNDSLQAKEILKSQIEVFINSLYEKIPNNNKFYTIRVYGANGVTYKVSLDLNGEYEIDIDYTYSDTVNSMEITLLEVANQDGFSIDFVKTTSDVKEKIDLTVEMIEGSEIVGKVNLTSDLVASGNSYTLKNNIEVNFMGIQVSFQIVSDINFKQVQIDSLTGENCVYLDELDQDTLEDIVQAIAEKTQEVILQNLNSQGVKKPEDVVPTETPATINTDVAKETSKNKLINAISAAMTEAQEAGRTYTLIDLMTLDIPESTFSVSLDGDIAILNIDGFEFKLNSEFQLYE